MNMLHIEPVPPNPALLAKTHITPRRYDIDPATERAQSLNTLILLDKTAEALDFIDGRYIAKAGLALAITTWAYETPRSRVSIRDVSSQGFAGVFKGFAEIEVNDIPELNPVKTLCLTFDQVTLLPTFETLHREELLQVPALAIDDIERIPLLAA